MTKMTRFWILALGLFMGTGCSLVTVPVKTVGSLAETTVKTAGGVVEAPFKAVGGNRDSAPEPKPKKAE
jgi:hypothetical protein